LRRQGAKSLYQGPTEQVCLPGEHDGKKPPTGGFFSATSEETMKKTEASGIPLKNKNERMRRPSFNYCNI
jgi:hypothetical protein